MPETTTATDPRNEGKAMGRALREGWRRREIRQAVAAFYVLNRKAARVEDIAAITGRTVAFTTDRLPAVEGVRITAKGVLPEVASVAGCLIERPFNPNQPRVAFVTTKSAA